MSKNELCKNCGHQLRKKRFSSYAREQGFGGWMHKENLLSSIGSYTKRCLVMISKKGDKPPYTDIVYCRCEKPESASLLPTLKRRVSEKVK